MFKVFTKNDGLESKGFIKAAKKFGLKKEEIELVVYDRFLASLVFMLAVSKKKLYVLSTDNKKPEIFDTADYKQLLIDKKTDLNLYLRSGRVINLTSVVGVKPLVIKATKELAEKLNSLR